MTTKHGSKATRSFKAASFLRKNKISTPPALAYFERWDKGRTFNGPWPVKLNKVLDCLGKEIELIEIKDQPVYLINSNQAILALTIIMFLTRFGGILYYLSFEP